MVSEPLFKKPILERFIGHSVPHAIGPLTDHTNFYFYARDAYTSTWGRCVRTPTSTRDKTI